MYALISELLHDPLCNIPTYYNLSKINSLSFRLSSMGHSLVISATRITSVLDYCTILIDLSHLDDCDMPDKIFISSPCRWGCDKVHIWSGVDIFQDILGMVSHKI
jgi:hypothetical protein